MRQKQQTHLLLAVGGAALLAARAKKNAQAAQLRGVSDAAKTAVSASVSSETVFKTGFYLGLGTGVLGLMAIRYIIR